MTQDKNLGSSNSPADTPKPIAGKIAQLSPETVARLRKVREHEGIKMRPCRFLRSEITLDSGAVIPLVLRAYQCQMIFNLLVMKRFVVGDDTGLGKTLEATASLAYAWEQEPDLVAIVVTTKSALRQWAGEIRRFCTEEVCVALHEGDAADRQAILDEFFAGAPRRGEGGTPPKLRVLVTTYTRFRLDRVDISNHLQGRKYALILDEATAFKNTTSQTHLTVRAFADGADRVWALTATLLKNRLEEGYAIYKVVYPHLFASKAAFLRDFCITRQQTIPGRAQTVQVVVGHSKAQVERFRQVIWPYYLGRPKHAVAKDLPVLTRNERSVQMDRKQWLLYLQAVEGALQVPAKHIKELKAEAAAEEAAGVEQGAAAEALEEAVQSKLARLIYCQEVANSPALLGSDESVDYTTWPPGAKEQLLLELLDEEEGGPLGPGEKVIVFTRFRAQVDRLVELLTKTDAWERGVEPAPGGKLWQVRAADPKAPPSSRKRRWCRVTGAEDTYQREAARSAFVKPSEEGGADLIFLTMAGSESLNLQQARFFLFFDLPWSAGDYLQLIGRMIRIGSPHQRVMAMHLLATGPEGQKTIDHYVSEVLLKKMDLIERVLGSRLQTQDDVADEVLSIQPLDPDEQTVEVFLSTEREVDQIFTALQSAKGASSPPAPIAKRVQG
jgi:superfamily II DNA/RNA helicase